MLDPLLSSAPADCPKAGAPRSSPPRRRFPGARLAERASSGGCLALLPGRRDRARQGGGAMARLRICSVNGEWMNDWFTPDAVPDVDWRAEFTRDGQVNDTQKTAGRLAAMIRAIDPDVLALEEGPSRPAELALFVKDHLGDDYAFFLGDTGAQQ